MEKDIDHEITNVKKGITLSDALGYRVCDTIVAASALTMYGALKLKAACRRHYKDYLMTLDVPEISNSLASYLTDQANKYVDRVNTSQVTKHGRTKEVDFKLLESVVHKTDGNNSTIKNITCMYNKRKRSMAVCKSTIAIRLRRRLDFSYRKIKIRNVKVKGTKYKKELLLYYARHIDALRKGDWMISMDESSFNDRNAEVKSWQKKNCQTHVHYDKGRVKSVSVMSAVTSKDCILTHYNTRSNDSGHFIDFVKELVLTLMQDPSTEELYTGGRCHLILDNARIHRSEESIGYLKSTRLQVTYLPTYSPMLNNVELYWGKIKSHTRKYIYNDT